jgi:hypothetical protein
MVSRPTNLALLLRILLALNLEMLWSNILRLHWGRGDEAMSGEIRVESWSRCIASVGHLGIRRRPASRYRSTTSTRAAKALSRRDMFPQSSEEPLRDITAR